MTSFILLRFPFITFTVQQSMGYFTAWVNSTRVSFCCGAGDEDEAGETDCCVMWNRAVHVFRSLRVSSNCQFLQRLRRVGKEIKSQDLAIRLFEAGFRIPSLFCIQDKSKESKSRWKSDTAYNRVKLECIISHCTLIEESDCDPYVSPGSVQFVLDVLIIGNCFLGTFPESRLVAEQ